MAELRLPRALDEQVRDHLCRAQAAASDGHKGAVLRHLKALHEVLVPFLDGHLQAAWRGQGEGDALPSCGLGLLGLYEELLDIDIEREPIVERLLEHLAALSDEDGEGSVGQGEGNVGAGEESVGQGDVDVEDGWPALEARLLAAPLPLPRWWRRLLRSAAAFGDRARVQVLRGAEVVLERLPAPGEAPGWTTELGPLAMEDRLTLQVQVPAPGRLALLYAVGSEEAAELTLVWPAAGVEEAPRRALEVVEVVGEVAKVDEAAEHCLIVVWAPEEWTAGWLSRVLQRGRLLPGNRVWRYRYAVG